MNKKKIIGLLISLIGMVTLFLTIWTSNSNQKGISALEILVLVSCLILIMGGISFYQNVKDYIGRQKFIKIGFPISLLIILVGYALKYLGLPMAGIFSIFGSFFLCFGVIPVIAKNRYIRWKKYTNSKIQIIGLMICDSLGLALLLLSGLFYMQKWPGSLIMIVSGIIMIIIALLLWSKKFESLFSFQTEAKIKLEEQHKEIIDSINYAERIQRSFLATDHLLNDNLNEYFVYFNPKEAVSGDFYWAAKLNNGNFAMVNADSTGHGVPGAIMSILNVSSIEKAVENNATNPSDIFNQTRKTIIERLKKDGSKEGGKDGMDASIICFEFEKNKFTYTAAQNPIWVIRDGELTEIKPEKMPIGKHNKDHIPFEGGEFEIQKGDQIYTLTDGFQDQFGGPKGKKFMVKKMREYVLSISHLPMQEQHINIKDTFNNWKGKMEQVDDVCVIGVRI